MKNIRVFHPAKYKTEGFIPCQSGIYTKDSQWFISLSFEQEPELGEGKDSSDISQYPLEDVLDRFLVYVSDFYTAENSKGNSECYLEFSSSCYDSIKSLCSIIGKHVYNREYSNASEKTTMLIIE